MARIRWAMRMATPSKVRPPWASRSSWPLRVSLTDSISWRTVLSRASPCRAVSSLRDGRSSVMLRAARSASAWRPAKPLSVIRVRPGMRRAVAVARPPGHVRAPDRRPGAAAFHRGGVGDPDVVVPEAAVGGQVPDHLLDQWQRGTQPLVVARLVRQVRETTAQVAEGKADPPVLTVEAQQRLRHRQAHQFRLAEPGRAPRPAVFHQPVVDLHIQCRHEGVQISVHEGLRARRLGSNADLWAPSPVPSRRDTPMINTESLV